jgi:hypothetical protein
MIQAPEKHIEWDDTWDVNQMAFNARIAGIHEAYSRSQYGDYQVFALLLIVPAAVLSALLSISTGVNIFVIGAIVAVASVLPVRYLLRKSSDCKMQLNEVLDNDMKLALLGLEARGGVGKLPVRLLHAYGDNSDLCAPVAEYLDAVNLTDSQKQVWNLLIKEDYAGSIEELLAAAQSLG